MSLFRGSRNTENVDDRLIYISSIGKRVEVESCLWTDDLRR